MLITEDSFAANLVKRHMILAPTMTFLDRRYVDQMKRSLAQRED